MGKPQREEVEREVGSKTSFRKTEAEEEEEKEEGEVRRAATTAETESAAAAVQQFNHYARGLMVVQK